MKKLLIIVLMLLLISGCAAEAPAPEPTAATDEVPVESPVEVTAIPTEAPTATPEPAYEGPVFSAEIIGGGSLDESYIKGNRLTMLNFWATWCGPCVGEIPDLSRIHTDYADQGFGILGAMIEADEEGAKALIGKAGVSYPMIPPVAGLDDVTAGIQAIPTTIFLDAYGRQVGDTLVGSRSYEEWAATVETMLNSLQ